MSPQACPIPPESHSSKGKFNISRYLEDRRLQGLTVAIILAMIGAFLIVQVYARSSYFFMQAAEIPSEIPSDEPDYEVIKHTLHDLETNIDKSSHAWQLAIEVGEILRSDDDVGKLHIVSDDGIQTCAYVPEWLEIVSPTGVKLFIRYIIPPHMTLPSNTRYFDILIDMDSGTVLSITETSESKSLKYP